MKRTEIKQLLLQGLVALLVLLLPLSLLFTMPQLILSVWLTGLIVLAIARRQNPDIIESKKYQIFEKLLYFQIINWSFGFFFMPMTSLTVIMIPIVMLILAIKKERRATPKFIKWAKYVGFHLFNMILLFALLNFFPNIGGGEGFFVFTIIIFMNGSTAAMYLKFEPRIPRKKRVLSLLILIAMLIMTTLSMFPQYGGRLIDIIFGG